MKKTAKEAYEHAIQVKEKREADVVDYDLQIKLLREEIEEVINGGVTFGFRTSQYRQISEKIREPLLNELYEEYKKRGFNCGFYNVYSGFGFKITCLQISWTLEALKEMEEK